MATQARVLQAASKCAGSEEKIDPHVQIRVDAVALLRDALRKSMSTLQQTDSALVRHEVAYRGQVHVRILTDDRRDPARGAPPCHVSKSRVMRGRTTVLTLLWPSCRVTCQDHV